MSELSLTVFRLGLLVLLWFFVFSIVGVLRSDLYGTRVSRRSQRAAAKAAQVAASPAPVPVQSKGANRPPAQPNGAGSGGRPGAAAPFPGAPGSAPGAAYGPGSGPGAGPATGPGAGQATGPGGGPAYGQPAGHPRGRGGIPTTLVVTEGGLAGTSLPLTHAGILIGRNPECALVLDDDFASGRHARIFQRGGAWQVEDLGSTNGTFLDGSRLQGSRPVGNGSTLRIGRTTIELRG